MTDRPALELLLGDVLRFRRPHPCGGTDWRVDRLGADIGLRCLRCDRHVMIDRRVVERRLASFVSRGDPDMTAAAAPHPTEPQPARPAAPEKPG
jgi:hypothetical protein